MICICKPPWVIKAIHVFCNYYANHYLQPVKGPYFFKVLLQIIPELELCLWTFRKYNLVLLLTQIIYWQYSELCIY